MTTNHPPPHTNDHADALADNYDGRTPVTLADGWTARLEMAPDYDTTVEDDSFTYGRLEHIDRHTTGYSVRPDGFDGNAEKLSIRDATYWWQPPAHFPRDSMTFNVLRSDLRDLIEYGYHVAIVTVTHHRPDGYSRDESAALGGIAPFTDRGYLTELADDLLHEALALFPSTTDDEG